MKFSSKVENCGFSPMRKFHPFAVDAKKRGIKIYSLNIGQPDVETPPQFFDAISEYKEKVLSYAPSQGVPQLISAIKNYYDKLDMHFEEDEILITAGGSEALNFALQAILDDGDEVLIPEPYYPNYKTMAGMAGGKVCPIPTFPETGYRYAMKENIESRITPNTRAIVCTNPGNPTGLLLSHDEMAMIVDIAVRNDLFVIADEAYREFVYGGEKLASFGEFVKFAPENIIVIDTVSKRFSACGARIGCMISKNKKLMSHVMKLAQARLSVSTIDQIGAAALYNVGPEYFAAVRDEYRHRRDVFIAELQKIPGVKCVCPKGAFYVMATLPVENADDFTRWMLVNFNDGQETVMCAPAEAMYATPGKGKSEVRMAYVLKEEDLVRAAELLALGLDAYKNRASYSAR